MVKPRGKKPVKMLEKVIKPKKQVQEEPEKTMKMGRSPSSRDKEHSLTSSSRSQGKKKRRRSKGEQSSRVTRRVQDQRARSE